MALEQQQQEAIRFYCGVSERQWNHHPVAPGPYACISPVYGKSEERKPSERMNRVKVPASTSLIQDSGAFSDGPQQRLSCEEALARQTDHAERFHYASQVTHRASYDLLIDEKWENGKRRKVRWSEEDAAFAVKETVKAAQYLADHRGGLAAILSAQGVNARQYLACTKEIIPLLQEGDIFGLGGWCITGMMPHTFLPTFRETMQLVIPFLGSAGVKRVHVWGVCYAPALGELLSLCDREGIALSTDGTGPSVRPCRGKWGYASWIDKTYQRPDTNIRGLERARHVALTRDWLANFREREASLYRSVPFIPPRYVQPLLLEEIA